MMLQRTPYSLSPVKLSLKRSRNQHQSTAFSINKDTLSFQSKLSHLPFGNENISFPQNTLHIDTIPYQKNSELRSQSSPRTTLKARFSESSKSYEPNISELISSRIQLDNRASARDLTVQPKHSALLEEGNRIVVGPKFQLPKKVTQIYMEERGDGDQGNVNFIHGCLLQIGLYYFSINRKLILYNIKELYDTKLGNDSLQNPKIIEMADITFTIKEVANFQSELLGPKFKGRILIFSHPWTLAFFTYEISGPGAEIKLYDLGLRFDLRCQRVLHIDYDSFGRFYYLNSKDGTLNMLNVREYSWFLSLRSGKYALNNYVAKKNYSIIRTLTQGVSSSRRMTFCRRIKYFYKYFSTSFKSIFPAQYRCRGMFVDRDREMVFCLNQWDEHINLIGNNDLRTILAYSIDHLNGNTAPRLVSKISEDKIYQDQNSFTLCASRENFKIIEILPTSKEFQHSNIQVLISDGNRFLMSLNTRIKYIRIIRPPNHLKFKHQILSNRLTRLKQDDERLSRTLQDQQKEIFKSIESFFRAKETNIPPQVSSNSKTLAQNSYRDQFLAVCKSKGKVFSYFTYGVGNQNYDDMQRIAEVRWVSLTDTMPGVEQEVDQFRQRGLVPVQFKIQRVKDWAFMAYESQLLVEQQELRCKRDYSSIQSFQFPRYSSESLHALARQVQFPPQYYLMVTDCSIQAMVHLRPIDVVLTIMTSQNNRYQMQDLLLTHCLKQNGYLVKDICQMLMQIYYDPQGNYFLSHELIQKINRTYLRQNKMNQQFNTEANCKKLLAKRVVGGKFVKHTELKTEILTKVFQMILSMTDRQARIQLQQGTVLDKATAKDKGEPIIKLDTQTQKAIQRTPEKVEKLAREIRIDFMLTHVSRLVRVIWHNPIDEIPIEVNQALIRRLSDLRKTCYELLSIQQDDVFLVKDTVRNPLQAIEHIPKKPIGHDHDRKMGEFLTTINKIIEFLHFLENVTYIQKVYNRTSQDHQLIQKKIIFCQAFNEPMEYWERSMFLTIMGEGYNLQILDIWSRLFPSFICENFRTLVRVSLQLNNEESEENIIEALKGLTALKIPCYLIDYLTDARGFKNLRIFIKSNSSRSLYKDEQMEKNKNSRDGGNSPKKIVLPKLSSKIEQFNDTLLQVKQAFRPIKEKKFLLLFLERNIESLRDRGQVDQVGYRLKLQQLRKLEKGLSLQEFVKQSYQVRIHVNQERRLRQNPNIIQDYEKFYNQTVTDEEHKRIIQKLDKQTYNYKDLFNFIGTMNSSQLSLIYIGMFGEESGGTTTKDLLLDFFNTSLDQSTRGWPTLIKDPLQRVIHRGNHGIKLRTLIDSFTQFELRNILKPDEILHSIDVMSTISSKQGMISNEAGENQWYHKVTFNYFKSSRSSKASRKDYEIELSKFWMPQYLFSLGYGRQAIAQQFLYLLSINFQRSMQLQVHQGFHETHSERYTLVLEYLYFWLNMYFYIKECYPRQRNDFVQITETQLSNLVRQQKIRRSSPMGFNWSLKRHNKQNVQEVLVDVNQHTIAAMRTILKNLY